MSTGDAVDAFVAAHGVDVDDPAAEPELFEGFTDLLFDSAEMNAADPTRWSQTSAGWVLREFVVEQVDEELVVAAGERNVTDSGFVSLCRVDDDLTERSVIMIRRETSQGDNGA